MPRLHLVVVADRHVLDSELLVARLTVDGLVESVRPAQLPTLDLRGVALLLLDAACDQPEFDAATGARAVGLLYDDAADRAALLRRAAHPAVRLVLPRACGVAVLQQHLTEVLGGSRVHLLPAQRAGDRHRLSAREVEVLRLMAQGLGNGAIAESLGISPHTVRTHVQSVLSKLGRNSRVAAVGAARQAGLLPA